MTRIRRGGDATSKVNPDHRLVADALEADWNTRLRQLETLQREQERQRAQDQQLLGSRKRASASWG